MQKDSQKSQRFHKFRNSKIRYFIWPIRSHELSKFLPMALMMFSILLNQNIIRSIKDSLIMTMVGPEVISYIKLWAEMPAGIVFFVVYSKLCNLTSPEQAFRYIVIFFLVFFAIFGFIIFPNLQFFHPDKLYIANLVELHPHFKWFIIMAGNWSIILMYIMGELWPMIVFTLLFWQLANKITTTTEATRFYPFLTIIGQSNSLISGSIVIYFASKNHFLTSLFEHASNPSITMLKSLMFVVIITGMICLELHFHICKTQVDKISTRMQESKDKKLKLGLKDCFRMIAKSKYLLSLSVLLISYSLVMNFIEGIWMFKVRQLYPTADQFIVYQGKVLFWTGTFCVGFALMGGTIIQHWGWRAAAILTPIIMMIFGGAFYTSVVFEKYIDLLILPSVASSLVVIVSLGALQHIFGKGVKYSLFDSTKEMAYIPLDDEQKTKGKAAVDIVGGKIGKSIGAFIQFSTFTIFPMATYDTIAPYLMVMFILTCFAWCAGVIYISKDYNDLISKMQDNKE